jgi:hypothetical protein
MGATASRPPATVFSQCSHAYYHNWLITSSYASCLAERNHYYQGSVCGNGILEVGESCDCGSADECKDKCCDAATCQLKSGPEYQCSDNSSPCCKDCKLIGADGDHICRQLGNKQCDLVEYCDGYSPQCPLNIVQPTGTSCVINAQVGAKTTTTNSTVGAAEKTTTIDFPGLCYQGLCYSWEYTCAKYNGVPCPFQTAKDQCLNSKCLLYTKNAEKSTIKDCFDPFATTTVNTPTNQTTGASGTSGGTGGDDSGVGNSGTAVGTAIPTTPNGIPCANNYGQCLQYQCLATTSGDGRVSRPPNEVVLGLPPIGLAILCVTAGLIVALIVTCVIIKIRKKRILERAARNEAMLNAYGGQNGGFDNDQTLNPNHQNNPQNNTQNNNNNNRRNGQQNFSPRAGQLFHNSIQNGSNQPQRSQGRGNRRNNDENSFPLLPEQM